MSRTISKLGDGSYELTSDDGRTTTLAENLSGPDLEAAIAAFFGPDIPDTPDEIPMHKARKALKMLGPAGAITQDTYDQSWWTSVMAAIDGLPALQRDCILDDLNTAPNMVLSGSSTQMIRAAIGMSPDQLDAVAQLAMTLP